MTEIEKLTAVVEALSQRVAELEQRTVSMVRIGSPNNWPINLPVTCENPPVALL
jgi:hypothetical protein